jgi:O-acetylserine/cysteine efflux transporter
MIAVTRRDLALLVGINALWGLNLVVGKFALDEIPPILYTLLRFAAMGLVLLPWLRVHRGQMSALVVAALLAGAFNFVLSFAGLELANKVSSVAVASQLSIPFTTLLSVALLDEIVRWRRWCGIVLSFAGVVYMGFDPQVAARWQSLALVTASSFVGALGIIAVKRLHGVRPLELQAWFAWAGMPVLAGLALLTERPAFANLPHASLGAWSSLAYTVFASSLVAHTGYFHLIRRYPVTSVAPLTVLSPLFSVLSGALLLGERLTARIVAGGLCTLVGVLIITLRERRIPDTGK